MNVYPFLIRAPGTTRKRIIRVEGLTFGKALNKVLANYPSKFVNFKHARNMDLITSKQVAAKQSRLLKKKVTIYLNEKLGEFYLVYQGENNFPMFLEDEGGTAIEIGSARLSKFKVQAVYQNGSEVALEPEQVTTEQKTTKPKAATTKMKKDSKKEAKKATSKPVGKLVTMTVKAIKDAVKKGSKAFNESGKPLPIGYLEKMKDATREMKATILKAEAA